MPNHKTTLSKEIGERLRYARQSAKLSLTALSDRTGGLLAKSRISNYEQGIRRMGIEEARLLTTALGTVTPAFLLCIEDLMQLSADELDLLAMYRATDARGRATVRKSAMDEVERSRDEDQ